MTEDEVVKAFNGKVKRLEKLEQTRNIDGYCSLRMDEVEIEKEKYHAQFIFDNNDKKLIAVLISPNKEIISRINKTNIPENQFKKLEEKLIQKYNNFSYQDNGDGKYKTISHKRIWNFPSTSVELVYLRIMLEPLGEKSEILTLLYSKKNKENNL